MTYEEAEYALAGYYGFPSKTLEEARTLDEHPDLPGLVYSLDRLWELGHGHYPAAKLLRGHYPKEFGVDVHELILRPEGVELIKELIGEVVERVYPNG